MNLRTANRRRRARHDFLYRRIDLGFTGFPNMLALYDALDPSGAHRLPVRAMLDLINALRTEL